MRNLLKGDYVCRTRAEWKKPHHNRFVLSYYGPSHGVEFKNVKMDDYLLRRYKQEGDKLPLFYEKENGCKYGYTNGMYHQFYKFKNEGDKTWHIEITYEELENLELCDYHKVGDK